MTEQSQPPDATARAPQDAAATGVVAPRTLSTDDAVVVTFSAVLLPREGRTAEELAAEAEATLRPIIENDLSPVASLFVEKRTVVVSNDDDDADPNFYFAPHALAIDYSSTPLLPSGMLARITSHVAWPLVLVVGAALGVTLSSIALNFESVVVKYIAYLGGFFLLLGPLLMHSLMYYRGIVAQLVVRFEFWYLSVQIIVFSACETVRVFEVLHPVAALVPRFVLTGVAMIGLLCIDATGLSRVKKGLVMLIGSGLFVGLGASWRFQNTELFLRPVDLGVVQTTLGSLATSSYLTLGTFCAKFAFGALVLQKEVILLNFSWSADEATRRHARRAPATGSNGLSGTTTSSTKTD